jgi:hypothetical protein
VPRSRQRLSESMAPDSPTAWQPRGRSLQRALSTPRPRRRRMVDDSPNHRTVSSCCCPPPSAVNVSNDTSNQRTPPGRACSEQRPARPREGSGLGDQRLLVAVGEHLSFNSAERPALTHPTRPQDHPSRQCRGAPADRSGRNPLTRRTAGRRPTMPPKGQLPHEPVRSSERLAPGSATRSETVATVSLFGGVDAHAGPP